LPGHLFICENIGWMRSFCKPLRDFYVVHLLLNLVENPKRWSEKLGLLYKQRVIA